MYPGTHLAVAIRSQVKSIDLVEKQRYKIDEKSSIERKSKGEREHHNKSKSDY